MTMTLFRKTLTSLLLLSFVAAEDRADGALFEVQCPPDAASLTMAGLPGGNRLLKAWEEAYSEHCSQFHIEFEETTYGTAAARVCGSSLLYTPTDLASLGGSFFRPQATTDLGWNFRCKRSKLERNTILLDLGFEGVTFAGAHEMAQEYCRDLVGEGFTIDQYRWILSSFNEDDLASNGWDRNSVPYSDGDPNTHLWSEIHENCTNDEIKIAAVENNATLAFMYHKILTAPGETVRDHVVFEDDESLDAYIHENDAITYLHLYDAVSKSFVERGLDAMAVKMDEKLGGEVVYPAAEFFETGKYPLEKEVTIGFVDSEESLARVRPFLSFCLSDHGGAILKEMGYWPLREWEDRSMHTRLGDERGLDLEPIQESCGPEGGHLTVSGSEDVAPVMSIWTKIHNLGCPLKVDQSTGGSTAGAHRVCGDFQYGTRVDVGMMARKFSADEAVARVDRLYVHDCLIGDKTRSVIEVDVSLLGLVVLFPIGGVGYQCVSQMGGLTMDQLRWMFSSYSDQELEETGWNPQSLKNSDHDSSTHLWSELDERCPPRELVITGDHVGDGAFTAMRKLVLPDWQNGETIAQDRPEPYVEATGFYALKYGIEYPETMSYVGFQYYYTNKELFWAAPIKNHKGELVEPSEDTIMHQTYPLVTPQSVQVLNDEEVLRDTIPLIKFGYDRPELLLDNGFVPIKNTQEMLDRLRMGPYDEEESSSARKRRSLGYMVTTVAVVASVIFL